MLILVELVEESVVGDYVGIAIASKPSYLQSETYSTPLPIVHMTIKYTSEANRGVNELEEEPG